MFPSASVILFFLLFSLNVSAVYSQENAPAETVAEETAPEDEPAGDPLEMFRYTDEEESYFESVVGQIYIGMPKAELIDLINTEYTDENNEVRWSAPESAKRGSDLIAIFRDGVLIDLSWTAFDGIWEIKLLTLKNIKFRVVSFGLASEGPQPTMSKVTGRVPAKEGTTIGLAYEITEGMIDDAFDVQTEFVMPDGSSTAFNQPIEIRKLPAQGILTYTFSKEEALPPGEWTWRVNLSNQTLAEKTFEVYKP